MPRVGAGFHLLTEDFREIVPVYRKEISSPLSGQRKFLRPSYFPTTSTVTPEREGREVIRTGFVSSIYLFPKPLAHLKRTHTRAHVNPFPNNDVGG